MSVSKELIDVIKGNDNKGTKPYDTAATVTRVDGSIVWVHIPGGVDETPVKRTVDAKQGDVVQIRVSGGSAWINGNASAPPTDDTTAKLATEYARTASVAADSAVKSANEASEAAADAKTTADSVRGIAEQAQEDANTAKASAENASEYAARALGNLSTVQSVTETLNWITQHGTMALTTDVALNPTHVYFVVDPLGDYEVGGTHYSVVTEPDVDDIGTYYELSIDESLNNYVGTHLAVTSEGLWLIPEAGGNKILIATGGAGHTYEDAGTYIIDSDDITLASFSEMTVLGKEDTDRVIVTPYGITAVDINDVVYWSIKDLRENDVTVEYSNPEASADYPTPCASEIVNVKVDNTEITSYTLYDEDTDEAYVSIGAIHYGTTIYITYKVSTSSNVHPFTFNFLDDTNTTQAAGAFNEGIECSASAPFSHVEGYGTQTKSSYSHAEGYGTTASGQASHAEGTNTTASGLMAHSEGQGTTASGDYSHVEGFNTQATDDYAHAEGFTSQATGIYSHAEGKSTEASGHSSHAQNNGTKAQGAAQTVIGRYNIAQGTPSSYTSTDKALIIGNGSSNNSRSNALTVDWSGNVETSGGITDGNGNVLANKADTTALADYVLKATPYYDLDTTAASGTTDGDLYAAITALGWQSDVIE